MTSGLTGPVPLGHPSFEVFLPVRAGCPFPSPLDGQMAGLTRAARGLPAVAYLAAASSLPGNDRRAARDAGEMSPDRPAQLVDLPAEGAKHFVPCKPIALYRMRAYVPMFALRLRSFGGKPVYLLRYSTRPMSGSRSAAHDGTLTINYPTLDHAVEGARVAMAADPSIFVASSLPSRAATASLSTPPPSYGSGWQRGRKTILLHPSFLHACYHRNVRGPIMARLA